jgi:hypothetical protein
MCGIRVGFNKGKSARKDEGSSSSSFSRTGDFGQGFVDSPSHNLEDITLRLLDEALWTIPNETCPRLMTDDLQPVERKTTSSQLRTTRRSLANLTAITVGM